MTRFVSLLVSTLLILGTTGATAAPGDGVKIGFIASLTGLEEAEGALHSKAVKLALKQVNAAGGIGGAPATLDIQDSRSSPKGALENYEKLVDQDKVDAVIASTKSAQIVAILPKAKQKPIPLVIGGTSVRLTSDASQLLLRTRPDDSIAASAMVRYVKENTPYRKVAIVNDTAVFGAGGGNLVAKAIKEQGLTLVARETFTPGEDARFAPAIAAMKSAGAELVFVYVGTAEDHGKLLLRYRDAGKPFVYFGTPASVSTPALATAKDAAEGILAVVDTVLGQTPASKKYVEDYEKEYHSTPNAQSVYAYDGMMILAKAMNAVGREPAKVHDYIVHKMKGYPGVMGTYDFDEQGNGLHEASIVKLEGGKTRFIAKTSAR